ncbi:FG-GAP-like repeat-containing protein [Streptomyces sp. NPDC020096]
MGSDEAYWTAERMAAAVPDDAQRGVGTGPARRLNRPMDNSPGTQTGKYLGGIAPVGTFFTVAKGFATATYCTASVVHSPGHDLILTAGHCGVTLADGTRRIFVPDYRQGLDAAHQPSGVFPVEKVFVDPRYSKNSKASDSNLDFAFARVGVNERGRAEDVAGALRLTMTPSYSNDVTVFGYPVSDTYNKGQAAIQCPVHTFALPGYHQMQMKCGGFYGGVSGGPWITHYDAQTRTGDVIGNVGGFFGGSNSSNVDWLNYSPIYDQEIQNLYDDAVADRTPQRATYQAPTDTTGLPGGAKIWQHARLMASGDYTGNGHSDLIVVWSDGEITLYPGDGGGGFRPEHQLLPANKLWADHAVTITGGDFAGSGLFDLMVAWNDGEVTLYQDVSAAGLGTEIQMAKPSSIWKHASQIAAGRFHGTQYISDLVVRWDDGELTLYTNVGSGGFGQENQLQKPNDTWKNATLLTAGEFSGSAQWDLMVRWVDGELDNYVNTSPAGLGPEARIQDKNATWTHDLVMTAGDYTVNHRHDDLLVCWSDGETTLYVDTTAANLGAENTLVYNFNY